MACSFQSLVRDESYFNGAATDASLGRHAFQSLVRDESYFNQPGKNVKRYPACFNPSFGMSRTSTPRGLRHSQWRLFQSLVRDESYFNPWSILNSGHEIMFQSLVRDESYFNARVCAATNKG